MHRLAVAGVPGLSVKQSDDATVITGRYDQGRFVLFLWPNRWNRLDACQTVILPDYNKNLSYEIVGYWCRSDCATSEPDGLIESLWASVWREHDERMRNGKEPWLRSSWKNLPKTEDNPSDSIFDLFD